MLSLPKKWLSFLRPAREEGTMSEVTPETPAEEPAAPDNGGEEEPETETTEDEPVAP
jgi:hypothetical protein